ncbi:MAG: Diguanylate cyclase [Microgenomates group bacterium GW2011_GWC1_39_7b]|uniref:Diguanylate cyclase n=3 Tax=Candidatus Woeseibacteriota TaxID=1752722 RepID=A0A0G0PQS1_9BACT|nr:MAG: Diguanylate cyclase [Candidatus Woesebacteria bacterium GW2011_GWB1_39_10]KKR26734.1 MAG: Diguanylate cyclase [Microgenomates group bacterium GW2011_GWC1_39_7b]KKR73665.1 MAG: Diguanylate cyclase [Candidatus Woesebacteria bacterium GW2011_GWA2_40_7]KKS90688.1 MAG: Diguanylate cyclase [Candidatus Woesebacteria bacterium GW2011_GWA1_43_12]
MSEKTNLPAGSELLSRKDHHRARVDRIFDGLKDGTFNEEQVRKMLTGMLTIADLKGSQDNVMKMPNRSEFDKKVQKLVDEGVEFGFIIADIDHFKDFNDKYGHGVGDIVLALVGNSLKESLREGDFIARWGGEEIGILGFFKNEKELKEISERLRIKIAGIDHFTVSHEVIPGITVSLGAGIFKSGKFEDFFQKVDGKLYEAKKAGRNQVRIIESENV